MSLMIRTTIVIVFYLLFYTERAEAFKCISGSQVIDNTSESFGPGFFDVSISPVQLNKAVNQAELTNLSNYARCTGAPESYDALRAISLKMVSPALTDLGYELYLVDGDNREIAASVLTEASNICLWPDARCSGDYPPFPTFKTFPVFANIGIKRVAGSGNWHSAVTIPAGTLIAELEARVKMGKSWAYGGQDVRITWKFFLATEMASQTYTCALTQFDNAVTLPTVSRSAIVSHGTGRYPNAKKEFKFNLACDPQTWVYVTFEGDRLAGTGTDEVLENKLAGNPGVGIQLLFNDAVPVKFYDKLLVAASTQATEQLSFNAYYYYKGGAISGGPVKANATFTFDYQ